ncbi:hypothetical protein DIS18_10940 [Algibacter marinivivus]|uniref:PL28 ulvan lyase domain-containing protein n=1 Tax=Algibacter marinivivus TaxID=2100723 RepID=A0A2U2X4N6_9FLAO|nr:hypothetical protein [Algibacter marinivivus]PWH82741.1 hypothetical protein DIS18_10940 [Algibacter marinivivus]
MKKPLNLMKTKMLVMLALSVFVTSCSNDEQDMLEDDLNVTPDLNTTLENSNLASTCSTTMYTYGGGFDVNKNVNTIIDDRSCVYNYAQTTYGTPNTWGFYRLRANTSSDGNQTRIERASKVVTKVKSGNYIEISGTVRIAKAGEFPNETRSLGSMSNRDGTYFIQAKGRDTSGNGSPDPAIALFIAKATKVNGQDYFNIYREEIKKRGGSGNDRRLVYITRVKKNRDFDVKVRTGFSTNSDGSLRHYVNSTINGVFKSFPVPRADQALQAKLRMGAYRCKGGEAAILWRNVNTKFRNN